MLGWTSVSVGYKVTHQYTHQHWLAGWLVDMVTSPLAQTHEAFWTTPRHIRACTQKMCAHTNTHLHTGTRLPWCNRGKGAESKPKPRLIPLIPQSYHNSELITILHHFPPPSSPWFLNPLNSLFSFIRQSFECAVYCRSFFVSTPTFPFVLPLVLLCLGTFFYYILTK